MSKPMPFTIVGENIHTTRVVLRSGRHVVVHGDVEALAFNDVDGIERRLPVPGRFRETDEYAAGHLKHVAMAITTAMDGGARADDALAYLRLMAYRQERAGAAYLDLNVDELSPKLSEQKAAMRWLAEAVAGWTVLPLAIDSSHEEIIEAGLAACPANSRPMLNSASLERPSAVELAARVGGPVVVTAAGASGMPHDVEDRVTNATAMVEAALDVGIALSDVYVDPLIFPISVDGAFGRHALDAIAELRSRFGRDVHITGGMSNVSFGIPGRKIINEAFLRMAMDAGADSGIIDPVAIDLSKIHRLDLEEPAYALARNAVLGTDVACRTFLKAYRAGEFAAYGIVPPARPVA